MYIQMMIKVRNFHEKHQTYKTIHSINGHKVIVKNVIIRIEGWEWLSSLSSGAIKIHFLKIILRLP